MSKVFGVCFSKELKGNRPLSHIGVKLPVYLRLLDLCLAEGWEVYILTRRTFNDQGAFSGGWRYQKGEFSLVKATITPDLIYDRTGGIDFPPEDIKIPVINERSFKLLAWDKLATYEEIGQYMPKTFWVGDFANYRNILDKIKGEWIVLKPFNGLKGQGIYIGPKSKISSFKPSEGKKYIAQEFIDTSEGIKGLTLGRHDLRVAVINNKVVWCHLRVPMKGKLLANAAQGGRLTEVDYEKVPEKIKTIANKVISQFKEKYDNPIYSLDFGVDKNSQPYIFEVNDQIGFPRWEMRNRDLFLDGLINDFSRQLVK